MERSQEESGQNDGEGRLGESSGEGKRCMNKTTRKSNTFLNNKKFLKSLSRGVMWVDKAVSQAEKRSCY